MEIESGANINKEAIVENIRKIINQIYKLLPNREEDLDGEAPLNTIITELSGMDKLLSNYHSILFSLLCKLNGLYGLGEDKDFFSYRRTIFECLNLLTTLKEEVIKCQD